MKYIEFIGPPGAGKTTIYRKLIQCLQLTDKQENLSLEEAILLVSKQKMDKIYRNFINILPYKLALKFTRKLDNRSYMHIEAQNKFIAKSGSALIAFLTSAEFEKMSVRERSMVISSFLEIGSFYECINGFFKNDTKIFFEEGFIQKSFMFISPLDSKYMEKPNLVKYLSHIPVPDLTIYIHADSSLCLDRMRIRSQGVTNRLKNADDTKILNFLEISKLHLKEVIFWLKKNKKSKILMVENDKSIDNVVHDLAHHIRSI